MSGTSSSSKQLFGPESGESDSSSTENECLRGPGAFNFGWHSLHQAAKAHFTRDVATCSKKDRATRPYDNSKREARAAYVRKGDQLKKNGQSSTRISKLLSADQCLCYLISSFQEWFYFDEHVI